MNALMTKLGFSAKDGGYLAHGSDIGSLVARALALDFESCLGMYQWAFLCDLFFELIC